MDAFGAAALANGGSMSTGWQAHLTALVGASMECGHWNATADLVILAAENRGAQLVTIKRRVVMTGTSLSPFVERVGEAFNGTSGFINTNFTPSTDARSGSDIAIGVEESSNVASNGVAVGAAGSGSNRWALTPRNASNAFTGAAGSATTTFTGTVSDSRGYKVVGKAANSTTITRYENGAAGASGTAAGVSSTLTTLPLFIGARNNSGTADVFRASTIRLVDMRTPLSAASEAAWYAAIQAFMTAISP